MIGRTVARSARLASRSASRLAPLLAAAVALAGCYSTKDPLIESGDGVEISGAYTCREYATGRHQGFTFRARKDGNFFPDYSYAANRKVYRFRKLDEATYLAQEGDERNRQVNFFFIRPQGQDVVVLMPDLAGRPEAIESLLRANRVYLAGKTGNGTFLLDGTDRDKLRFLSQLAPGLLTEVAVCRPD
ncbi:hypothetical protein [Azorhizobium doebereinerae]|uniref:hypothetical protein n=1 Tax=Azorhizobium doebereinerae TaxID=281091 RepID=UPI0004141E1C|nr:hypothetical protein [Azorhizobium doebereinerae]